MTTRRGPDWLADFQARFGAAIRTPLDRSTGTLRAVQSYDPAIGARDERLAVYNRQYWFRIFTVFQDAFPLTARLFGHWHFNERVASFVSAHPPRDWDIDRATAGFEAHLQVNDPASLGPEGERYAEAAAIDAAFRAVFHAPKIVPYQPSAEDAARLLDAHLIPSKSVAVISEHWPLMELRAKTLADPGEAPISLPPRSTEATWWALVGTPEGIGRLPLERREGELFDLLRRHSVRDALGRLEAACSEDERADLPARTQGWLARSVKLGFWSGISSPARS